MPTIVLLNGPPRCGKDTLAECLAKTAGYTHMKFAQPLRDAVPAIFSLSPEQWEDLLEHRKDESSERLLGLTPREAMIWVSEDVCKPTFGDAFFGESLLNRLTQTEAERIVISDSGFPEEARVLLDHFGKESLRLIQLSRPNTSFAGDSRSRIHLDVPTLELDNNGHIGAMALTALYWLSSFYPERITAL